MSRNPIEENPVTRFVLGFAVIFAMAIGGGLVGGLLASIGLPYGDWIGVGVGAVIVFVGFAVFYTRYDDSYGG